MSMSRNVNHENLDATKTAVAAANGLGGGAVLEPADTASRTSHEVEDYEEIDTTTTSREKADVEKETPRDVELARTVSSGPPYTIFTHRKKQFIVGMAMAGGFFSPFSANIYFPALNVIAADLHVTNALVNLTLTTYMIFQGLAPTFMGDLADTAGRRPAFIIGFVIYIGACIGIALQNSFAGLLILRCVQSAGSSGVVALCSGVVADISTTAERGTYMGWVTSGMMIGPAIGPVLGGILSQFLGWRWIFWFLTILAGAFMIPLVVAFPETGRNVVGNGSIPPETWNMSLLSYLAVRKARKADALRPQLERTLSQQSIRSQREALAKKRKLKFPNPLKTLMICLEKDMGLLLLYNSIVYTAFYCITSTTPQLFEEIYGFNTLQIGLCYLPFGVGAFTAPVMNGRLLDWNFRRVAKAVNMEHLVDKKRAANLHDFPLERARVWVAIPLVLIGTACILCYGWVLERNANLAAPLILQFILGITLTGSFNVMNVMLVDNYPKRPATATAANNLVRCSMGAGGTAGIIYVVDALGRGWTFTLIAGIVFVSTSILLVLLKHGGKWRRARMDRMEAEETAQAEKDKL